MPLLTSILQGNIEKQNIGYRKTEFELKSIKSTSMPTFIASQSLSAKSKLFMV